LFSLTRPLRPLSESSGVGPSRETSGGSGGTVGRVRLPRSAGPSGRPRRGSWVACSTGATRRGCSPAVRRPSAEESIHTGHSEFDGRSPRWSSRRTSCRAGRAEAGRTVVVGATGRKRMGVWAEMFPADTTGKADRKPARSRQPPNPRTEFHDFKQLIIPKTLILCQFTRPLLARLV